MTPITPITPITPFGNESESLEIDEMTIENRLDQVVLYNSLQLSRDKPGLERARQLKGVLDAVLQVLEADRNLPDQIPIKPTDKVKNPFG